jgi:hypothetical protein
MPSLWAEFSRRHLLLSQKTIFQCFRDDSFSRLFQSCVSTLAWIASTPRPMALWYRGSRLIAKWLDERAVVTASAPPGGHGCKAWWPKIAAGKPAIVPGWKNVLALRFDSFPEIAATLPINETPRRRATGREQLGIRAA